MLLFWVTSHVDNQTSDEIWGGACRLMLFLAKMFWCLHKWQPSPREGIVLCSFCQDVASSPESMNASVHYHWAPNKSLCFYKLALMADHFKCLEQQGIGSEPRDNAVPVRGSWTMPSVKSFWISKSNLLTFQTFQLSLAMIVACELTLMRSTKKKYSWISWFAVVIMGLLIWRCGDLWISDVNVLLLEY